MQTARKPTAEVEDVAVDRREAPLSATIAAGVDHPSPARALQQDLRHRLMAPPAPDDGHRWAPRSALLLGGGVSLLFWGALAAAFASLH